jgi:hypothetical protein
LIAGDRPTEIEIKPNDYEADSNREHAENACGMLGKCEKAGGSVTKALLECDDSAALKKHHYTGKKNKPATTNTSQGLFLRRVRPRPELFIM